MYDHKKFLQYLEDLHNRLVENYNDNVPFEQLEEDRIAVLNALYAIDCQKEENNDLFYKLEGVMHSVDKWLEGEELEQDEVNRAVTMREKTLQIIEKQQAEIERLQKHIQEGIDLAKQIPEMVELTQAEAVKEFIKRFENKLNCIPQHHFTLAQVLFDLDKTKKEMVGDK